MTKTSNVLNASNQIIGIKVETNKETFTVPVLDVRRNRERVEQMEKEASRTKGSKFFKPSYSWYGYSYNASMKNNREF